MNSLRLAGFWNLIIEFTKIEFRLSFWWIFRPGCPQSKSQLPLSRAAVSQGPGLLAYKNCRPKFPFSSGWYSFTHTTHLHWSFIFFLSESLIFSFSMVLVKISFAFILAVAAISPIVALPLPGAPQGTNVWVNVPRPSIIVFDIGIVCHPSVMIINIPG